MTVTICDKNRCTFCKILMHLAVLITFLMHLHVRST